MDFVSLLVIRKAQSFFDIAAQGPDGSWRTPYTHTNTHSYTYIYIYIYYPLSQFPFKFHFMQRHTQIVCTV
jgi:hypothetical protein